jgi:hypothetical protein
VNAIRIGEGLDLRCKTANPTGNGIHNKMVLVEADGHGYVHTGSINGSENSSKNNREFAVQVQSDAAHDYLADVFWYDWGEDEPHFAYLPTVVRSYPAPPNQPTLLPIDNTDGDGNYTVTWTEQPQRLADTYTLEEASNATFTSGLRVVCTTTEQSCNVTDRMAGTYYYRVRGHNAQGDGPYSNVQTASVLVPGTPTLSPIANADGDGNYTVNWSAASRATSYTLQEDTYSNFPSPTSVYQGAALSWSATNKPVGTYYYRVRAHGPTGDSVWSATQSTTVSPPLVADLYIQDLVYDQSDERIQIRNRGTVAQDMTNWRIHSVVGDQWFYFPSGYTLNAGATVRVHSGPDAYDSPPTDLLWAYAYYWNNEGDKAVLYNSVGQQVDSVCYMDGCP